MSSRILFPLRRSSAVAALSLCLMPSASTAATDAAIRLPPDFAANSSTISLSGFNGLNKGDYEGGEFKGEFTRIESRLAVFDPLYVANRGQSRFTMQDAAGLTLIEASCEAVERTVGIKFVELDLTKLTYGCEFGGPEATGEMRFVLGEPKREGFRERLLARERRAGEASVLGRDFVFESVHEYEGSRLDAQAPLGYLVRSGETVVAAVDLLDWDPIVHLHSSLTNDERKAAMIVALALSVLRDPANSVLEDQADLDD